MERFFDRVESITVKHLTKRKAKRLAEKQNRTFLSEALSWIDAILFAVVVVFLVNQFLFQFFVIPSPSMLDTLLVKDRVMVSKLTYGIETYPQGPKILDSRTPDRDDIITFYNPEYESKGPVFNVISTLLYMVTFSLVNIDVDDQGNMREKLLVKRAGAVAGDTVKFIDGIAYIKLSGTDTYINEADFRAESGLSVAPHRTIEDDAYIGYNAYGRLSGLLDGGVLSLYLPKHLVTDQSTIDQTKSFTDLYAYEKSYNIGRMMADPTDLEARSEWAKAEIGVYVPEGYVLPLGDNRDNSRDGRYFGPVSSDSINGRVVLTVWPLGRVRSLIGE